MGGRGVVIPGGDSQGPGLDAAAFEAKGALLADDDQRAFSGEDDHEDEDAVASISDGLAAVNSMALSCQVNAIGVAFVALVSFKQSMATFFVFFACGGFFLFTTTSAMNIAVMESVPHAHRSFAIGFSTLLMHC